MDAVLMENALLGGRVVKHGYFAFYKCPACGNIQESLLTTDSGSLCFRCRKHFPKESFSSVRVRRRISKCNQCRAEIPLSDNSAGGLGYMCDCGNYLALHYGNRAVEPDTVLDVKWNRTVLKRAQPVAKGRGLTRCRTRKDVLVIHAMQVLVQQEDSRFRHFTPEESTGELYVDTRSREYLGFLIWNKHKGLAGLRQLFIMPKFRRQGLATELVSFWVANIADKLGDRFGVEAPNEKASALHEKLGHIVREGEGYRAAKAFFLPTF